MTPKMSRPSRWAPLLLIIVVLLVVALVLTLHRLGWQGEADALVVYCAHDSVYSDKVLRDFSEQTGIPVAPKYDTEATKSLGLVELLIREKDNPRCDVFWNNELLGTMDLEEKGVLLPYKGGGYERIPDRFKDPEGHWAGFGARLRVYIINTDKMKADPGAVEKALAAGDLSRFAVAKPIYGTTLTHYCVLWDLWGAEKLKAWHRDLRARKVCEVTGNAHAKNVVAQGVCDLGWTDTDDYFVARHMRQPVAALPVRVDGGATICIPNTACIIKGTGRLEQAQALVDYLLSADCEIALANAESRQIPLGPLNDSLIPKEVREMTAWVKDGYSLAGLGAARAECLAWLKEEYLK